MSYIDILQYIQIATTFYKYAPVWLFFFFFIATIYIFESGQFFIIFVLFLNCNNLNFLHRSVSLFTSNVLVNTVYFCFSSTSIFKFSSTFPWLLLRHRNRWKSTNDTQKAITHTQNFGQRLTATQSLKKVDVRALDQYKGREYSDSWGTQPRPI